MDIKRKTCDTVTRKKKHLFLAISSINNCNGTPVSQSFIFALNMKQGIVKVADISFLLQAIRRITHGLKNINVKCA
jgi:hypothetical protein